MPRLAGALLLFAAGSVVIAATAAAPPSRRPGFGPRQLQAFSSLEPIDSHTHIDKDDPAYQAMLRKLHLHILDIVDVSDNGDPERRSLDKEEHDVFAVTGNSHGHVSVCTSFDPYRINEPDFTRAAIARLNESFIRGAIAVKVWKNVGMEIKDRQGQYVLPDAASLEPIYRDIAAHHRTLITHVADPDIAWKPLNGSEPDEDYYREHPEWHMLQVPGAPTKAAILRARDHLLAMNPDLRVVGAHLGSMESNLDDLAQHLDRYANFAVDLAGRMPYLQAQPRSFVIAFVTKYQDRLLYGTDDTLYPHDDGRAAAREMESAYAADWLYLSTHDRVRARGRTVEGLDLPRSILRKIYHDNATHWFPGLLETRPATSTR